MKHFIFQNSAKEIVLNNVYDCQFQGFNKEMEEMCRVQRSYSIPDRELCVSLKRDNMEYILPKYQVFYDK